MSLKYEPDSEPLHISIQVAALEQDGNQLKGFEIERLLPGKTWPISREIFYKSRILYQDVTCNSSI